jgi:hypothetical protein
MQAAAAAGGAAAAAAGVVSGCCGRALAPALYVGEWCQGAPGEVLWGRAANRAHCLPLLLLAAPAAGHLLSVCWLVMARGPRCHGADHDASPPGHQGRGRAKVPSATAYPLAGFAVAAACGLRSMCRCGCVAVLVLYGWVHPPSLSVTRGARPCGGKEGSPDPYSGQGCCPGNEFSRAGKVVLALEAGRSAVYAQHADCVVWRGKCETPQVCVQPSVISVCEPPGPVVQARAPCPQPRLSLCTNAVARVPPSHKVCTCHHTMFLTTGGSLPATQLHSLVGCSAGRLRKGVPCWAQHITGCLLPLQQRCRAGPATHTAEQPIMAAAIRQLGALLQRCVLWGGGCPASKPPGQRLAEAPPASVHTPCRLALQHAEGRGVRVCVGGMRSGSRPAAHACSSCMCSCALRLVLVERPPPTRRTPFG